MEYVSVSPASTSLAEAVKVCAGPSSAMPLTATSLATGPSLVPVTVTVTVRTALTAPSLSVTW